MTPEEEAAAALAAEEAKNKEGQPSEKPVEGSEELKPPKRLFANKYETPETLEAGYSDVLEQKNRVENENAQLREALVREQSESQAQVAESTSAAEVQKTQRQSAEELLRKGDWLGSQRVQAEESVQAALKPLTDRQDALDKEARIRESIQAFESLNNDSKNFPKFGELEPELMKIYDSRIKLNPDFDKSFASYKHMMASIYFEARSQHPEIFSTGRELAAAVSSGSAAGARARGVPPVSQEKKPDYLTEKRWSKLGMPANPYQFEESKEDITNRRMAEEGEALNKLLAGQVESE